MYRSFSNPATSTFAWVGAEKAEVIFLNDFRWNPQIIQWHDLLLMLEGQQVQFPLVMIGNRLRLDELGCDNLETWRTRQLAPIMYKLKNHIAPDHLAQSFNTTSSMYPYNLRNSKHNLFAPRLYTEAENNSFHHRRAVFWKSL